MDPLSALRSAIDLVQVPSRVRIARSLPLPDGMELLLRIAAGDGDCATEAAAATGRDADFVREAATFFIEQVLLEPGADSYRVLGVAPEARTEDLRRNLALLMRCLHPDASDDSHRSVFAGRITGAWEDLKTPQRRAMYDAALAQAQAPSASSRKRRRYSRRMRSIGGTGRFEAAKVTTLLRRWIGPRNRV
ncbi:MAG: DnaJ domain-containing protein [Hyphomicrobiaceae bacterium]